VNKEQLVLENEKLNKELLLLNKQNEKIKNELKELNEEFLESKIVRDKAIKEEHQLRVDLNALKKLKEVSDEQVSVVKSELEESTKVRDYAIKEEHSLKLQLSSKQERVEELIKVEETLRKTLNDLADLFNLTFVSLKDLNVLFSTIERNSKNVIENIENKLEVFNNPKGGN
jgi:chromosome segregation ATPase